MINEFFERDIYKELTEWAQEESNYALYLRGPRQVGKTSILEKLGDEHFDVFVYIDLRVKGEAQKFEERLHYHKEQFGYSKFDHKHGPMWELVFREYEPKYTNNAKSLVVIDEIQESVAAYNSIRSIRRSLKSKFAVTGSYLGIISRYKDYNMPAGDVQFAEMSSLTFVEFLRANNVWDEYSQIKTFNHMEMNDAGQAICEKVRELYRTYCQIGGYPDVVREWVTHGNMDKCKKVTARLLESFYGESSSYFEEVVGRSLWGRTLAKVAASMVTKLGDLDISLAKEGFRNDDALGLEIRRRDRVNALKWLDDCHIIGTVPIYDGLESVASISNKSLFFFRDMGLMTQLCEDSELVLPSDLAGIYAENFVYLHLLDEAGKFFVGNEVHSFSGTWGQIDFVMRNKQLGRCGIEVKHGSGGTKSGDKALADGKIDYLIRVQDTYGSVSDKQATIPIFMLDKLGLIVSARMR
ncbi:MAG: AAA family ATPase [Defluviitaleaceae bacterium]|nr:AAA family ATPase [Defluviitaleaceae bacterium]